MTVGTSGWRAALDDLAQSVERRWLWTRLGWEDVRQRHSGSRLGSLWITANIALMVTCLTVVFAGALGDSVSRYAPYVAIGLVLWQFISASLNEGSQVFATAAETIRNTPMPLSLHVFRLVWRNLVVMAHHVILLPVLLLVFRIEPSRSAWLAGAGVALLTLFAFFASLLLGLIGARFRDVLPIVANLLQLLFFLTPVFWQPSALDPSVAELAVLNPFTSFIEIVRAPILGGAPPRGSWAIAIIATAATGSVALLALSRFRARVVYWI
jgi:ABC-type polysaccharide/polyol phosphate export permease